MALSVGTRLGFYEVVAPLGVGGMGEVYRARDTKLNRDVAIKVLPELFAADPDRLARFKREAQVLASLNHPNIAHIHGLEDSQGVQALVMELIEGEDLAQRLSRGRIALLEALPIARQIAEALEAAHEQGIVHRDLKPANIKVRDDGTVKVLDFGLAKALEPSTDSNVTNSPTLTLQATQVGIILGTAAYMAPEQAHGRAADRRADVFAFGAVLFEILSGKQAFAGESVSDTLASILKLDPDWSQLPLDTPAGIRTLLRRCLTKDRAQRLQAIGEARIVLAQPAVDEPEKPAHTKRGSFMPWFVTGLTTIVAIVALWGWLRPRPVERRPVIRFANAVAVGAGANALAISPDGTRLAFVSPRQQIFIRSIDQFDAEAIPNTENATFPSFSPDGRWISYVTSSDAGAGRRLMKVSVAGGPVQKLADWGPTFGPPSQSWGTDGNILFNSGGAVARISSSGGPVQTIATPDIKSGENYYHGLHLLPGGMDVLASIPTAAAGFRLAAFNLSTGQKKVLLDGAGPARFLAAAPGSFDGYLVWYDATSSSLLAAPFDAKRLEIKATPVPVIDGIRSGAGPFGTFAISDSGTLAYVPGGSAFASGRTMVWMDRKGVEQSTTSPPRQYNGPRLSPDGQFVAVEIQGGFEGGNSADIWVYDLARNSLARITSEGFNLGPQWTPDGKRLIYASGASPSTTTLMSAPPDRSAPPFPIAADVKVMLPTSVSPDGESVIGIPSVPAPAPNEIAVVPLSGRSSAARSFPTSRFRKLSAVFSPNGRWVAYSSNDSGRLEIYVSAYPGPGGTTLISDQGGTAPRWSRDGRQLFYRNGAKMVAVDVQLAPTFRAGRPEVLFEAAGTRDGFDVAPDGQRFLMIKNVGSADASQPAQLNVVVNWIEELRARLSAK